MERLRVQRERSGRTTAPEARRGEKNNGRHRELATRQSIRLSELVRRALAEKATESSTAAGGLFQRMAGVLRRVDVAAS
jgi:hypothetical protein